MTRKLNQKEIQAFQTTIWDYYHTNGRKLPWRETSNPYLIFVSEVMLQQTLVPTVLKKYPAFISRFPTFQDLAEAPFSDLLRLWKGLGYNRRALNLQKSSQIIVEKFNGELPRTVEELDELPGIGNATACSIIAFAFNLPVVFIETNIRRVYIHHFLNQKDNIPDSEIIPFVEKTLDTKNVREWYWALMDYGSYLAKIVPNPNRKSRHYNRQSTFAGSDRQIRGQILSLLLESNPYSKKKIMKSLNQDPDRITEILMDLEKDHMIKIKGSRIELP